MLFLFLPFFAVLSLFLYWDIKNKHFEKLPGPPGVFLLQNTLDFLMDTVKLFYHMRMLCNKYKRLLRLRFGPLNAVVLYSPKDIEAILSETKYNRKGIVYNFIKPWLQSGLLTSKGLKWQQRRKLLTPAFHFNVMAHYKLVIEENCQKFVEKLGKEINKSKTDITPYVNDFALYSICEAAMGVRLDDEDKDFGKTYKEAIYKLGQYAIRRAQRIWMYPSIIFKHTTFARKQENILNALTSFRDRVIENRRNLNNNLDNDLIDNLNAKENENIELTGRKKMAMLDLLLRAEKDGVIDAAGIGEEVDTFMFGGHDTSANALQFAMMLLANNQDIQEKVVQECDEIFGSFDRPATVADLSQMKYLECCIKETMRLYPPLPLIVRFIQDTLQLENYEIPAGTECAILIFDLHRRPDQFVEPLEFRPERFQIEPTWHPYAYIPFSAGPRNCIGQKFAMMELKLVLSTLLRRYRLLPVTKPSDVIFVADYVLRTKEHIYVKFEERR